MRLSASRFSDDLNTPLAISALHERARQLNKSTDPAEQAELKAIIINSGYLLGLLQRDAETYFKGSNSDSDLDEATINNLLAERDAAKLAKNYARADEIRNQLTSANIELEDTKDGTRWRYAN